MEYEVLFKEGSLTMETNNDIQTDIACCKMKSVKGYCPRPLETASEFLSKKWTISIVITIGNFCNVRFNNLRERLEGATAKTITARLRELEKEGVITRRSFSEVPPRVEYSLTKNGKKLLEALHPLIHWAEKNNRQNTRDNS